MTEDRGQQELNIQYPARNVQYPSVRIRRKEFDREQGEFEILVGVHGFSVS
jgi:hypothetical protein